MSGAIVEAVLAVGILCNVMALGLGMEVVRKVGKGSQLLRAAWRAFRRRCPHTGAAVLHFTGIWDQFAHSSSEIAFEDRFAVFCDQLGDFLEMLVSRAVDVLESVFAPDLQQTAAALADLPRWRLSAAEVRGGVGSLHVTACSICLSDFAKGEEVRLLPSCQHAFHSCCVDTWLSRQNACPCCRTDVMGNITATPPSP